MLDDLISEIVAKFKRSRENFLIGTAASAHQVEGGNRNDWTQFEQIDGNIDNGEISGDAVDHYNRYEEDFQTLKELGFSTHRLSIEWSRIYPEENTINQDEIQHYRDVLTSLKNNDQISMVTLHHFTSPIWFIEKGGFKHKKNLKHWKEFVRTVCNELGDYIDVFNTINEPFVYCTMSYLQGLHAPGERGYLKYAKVGNNLMRAHFMAVEIIRELQPGKPVGIVKNLINFNKKRGFNPINSIIKSFMDWAYNKRPISSLKKQRIPFGFTKIKEGDIGDFIGVNYYIKGTVGLGYPDFMLAHGEDETRITQVLWGQHPEGMASEIKKLTQQIDLPIFITENGIATEDDEWRVEYIAEHLKTIADLIEEGIDIRGYYYWSNLDNFEWAEGYRPTFGLISVNRDTMVRTPKPSAEFLGKIAQELSNGKMNNLIELSESKNR